MRACKETAVQSLACLENILAADDQKLKPPTLDVVYLQEFLRAAARKLPYNHSFDKNKQDPGKTKVKGGMAKGKKYPKAEMA